MNGNSRFLQALENDEPSLRPQEQPVSVRSAFYLLANIDEHPEVLPMAYDIAMEHVPRTQEQQDIPADLKALRDNPNSLPQFMEWMNQRRADHQQPWHNSDAATSRRLVMHYLTQYAPTALVDGCWLQCVLRVAIAHSGH